MRKTEHAFTLVEVTMSIGIVAFAFLAVSGLIPTGLGIFKQSINQSVAAQIAQLVIADAQQSDFDSLLEGRATSFCKPTRYFDSEGEELPRAYAAIYHVKTRVLYPAPVPGGQSTNSNLALVTVQVASNPGNKNLAEEDATSPTPLLWTGAFASESTRRGTVPLFTFSTQVARNR